MLAPVAPAARVARCSVERPRTGPRSVVREAYAETPWRLLRPWNHGHAVWIFTTMLGPGLLRGDDLELTLTVGPGATCYVGSIGVMRAFAGRARLTQRLRVEAGGLLVWAPDALACGRGAELEQTTHVTVEDGGSLLLVDALTAGRPAQGERWEFTRLRSSLQVSVGGEPWLHEQLDLRPASLPVARHFEGVEAMAVVAAVGPRTLPTRAAWTAREEPRRGSLWISSERGADGALGRAATASLHELDVLVTQALGNLLEMLGDAPRSRRF